MNITTISVSSSRKLPHPNADFGSISSMVTLEAALVEGDMETLCAKNLQETADYLVEQHIDSMVERTRQHVIDRHEAMKARRLTAQPQIATENTAAELAAKHGGKA